MDSATARPRTRRTSLLLGTVAAVMLGTGVVTAIALNRTEEPQPVWRSAPLPKAELSVEPTPSAPPTTPLAADPISLSATGDIIMAQAPSGLPPNNGRGFFAGVADALAADVVMGNLEEPLTDDTGHRKCAPTSTGCHQFRAPPSYAAHLRDAGFDLLNLANNHGNDFGEAGHRNTQRALESYGLAHTGDPDQITTLTVKGVKVGVLGFSSYRWSNSLIDLAAAREVVERAAAQVDLVVVQVHMGAEGSGATRVRPGTEMFLGENRGDPIAFAHTVIDAGADLVVGHGPHVMRAMEFYRGRLIAYSLGNFAGGAGTLKADGNLGLGAILKVSLHQDGSWASGSVISTTHQSRGGLPRIDSGKRGLSLVRSLCRSDFPTSAPVWDANGGFGPRV